MTEISCSTLLPPNMTASFIFIGIPPLIIVGKVVFEQDDPAAVLDSTVAAKVEIPPIILGVESEFFDTLGAVSYTHLRGA